MKQTLLLLAVLALCLAACKREPDDDPHVPPVNPFIGVWSAEGQHAALEYWEFRPNGTGGRAAAQAGPFPDDFSFLFFNGKGPKDNVALPGLLILEGSPVTVTRYGFSIAGNQATLTPVPSANAITLERVSGSPQVISLTNQLIGEWSAIWNGDDHDGAIATWSIKYYDDGTVKTYHHRLHQFENAYALRGNTLVIFGAYRYTVPVVAEIHQLINGKWHVEEKQSNYGLFEWTYTKVDAAKWK